MKYILFWLLAIQLYAYTPKQIETIKHIKVIAKQYTKYQSDIAAIADVESDLGINPNRIGDDGKSYGTFQIQVPTVRWLATIYPELEWTNKLKDLDIAKLLLFNLDFSVMIACKYFEHYRKHWGRIKAIMVYNGGTENWTYYNEHQKAKEKLWHIK